MTIPTSRAALVASAVRSFTDLEATIDAMPPAEQEQPLGVVRERDRDVEDILNHLHAWHVLLLGWIDTEAAGGTPAFPADGYTWNELDALNHALRDEYRLDDLRSARERLSGSHEEVLARVETIGDVELFEKGRHNWMRGQLAEPVHECLGGHYEWALGALEAGRASRDAAASS